MPAGPAGIGVAAVGGAAHTHGAWRMARCCACCAAACSTTLASTRVCVTHGGSRCPKGAGVNATPGSIAAGGAVAVGAGTPKPAGTAYRAAYCILGSPRAC